MKHRIVIGLAVVIFGIIFWKIDYFKDPEVLGICSGVKGFCKMDWLEGVWFPILNLLPYLISSLALLIFFPYSFLKTWLKIMVPYFIIAFIVVVASPALCGGVGCIDRTLMATGLSKIFLGLTILILLSKSVYLLIISKRKSKKQA